MRNQVFKKLFSVLLALIMVAGLLPASVLAEGWGEIAPNAETTPAATAEPTAEPTADPTAEPAETTEPTDEPVETAEPTAEPAEGEEPAEPVQEETPAPEDGILLAAENVTARDTSGDDFYRIVHLDCGRKYFSKKWIIALMREAKAAGYNQIQLAFGNKGLRLLLNDMSVTVDGKPYNSEDVTNAIQAGNKAYYNADKKNELTQAEMEEIFTAASEIGIEIVPLFNTPFHMEAVITAMGKLGISNAYYSNNEGSNKACLNLGNSTAVAFVKALMQKYISYFAGKGCKFFNFGADEYVGGWNNTFYSYANDVAKMISKAGMTARAFNDSFRDGSNTYISNEYLKEVCYWYSGYSENLYSGAKTVADNGYALINTNKDFYYVLDSSKSGEYELSSGKYNNGNNSWESYAGGFSNTTYNAWNTSTGNKQYTNTPAGSMFCIWCDAPSEGTETEVAQQIRMILRVIGARMQGSDSYSASDVLVEGGFKADGTINVTVNNITVGNTNGNTTLGNTDAVRVTGPELATLTCEAVKSEITGINAAEGKMLVYDVTPATADKDYSGEAKVSIKIPDGWDKTKVKAFIVEKDGTANSIDDGTATEDGWYVFTAPHFSVMGIYEQDVTYVEETVTVAVGDSKTVMVDGTQGEKVENGELSAEDGTTVANYKVEHVSKTGGTTQTVGNEVTLKDSATVDVLIGDWQAQDDPKRPSNYMVVANGTISGTTNVNEATVFTVTRVNSRDNNYYTIKVKDGNKYIIRSNNGLSIGDSANQNNSWSVGSGNDLYYSNRGNYYLTYSNANNEWGVSNSLYGDDWKTVAHPYSFNTNTTPAEEKTEITFTGVKEGTTSVVIGGTRYTVKVVDKTLADAKLYVDFWVTSNRVKPNNLDVVSAASIYNKVSTADKRYYHEFTAADSTAFASEEGVLLTELIPSDGIYTNTTGTTNTIDAMLWKVRYLPQAYRQTAAGWTNKSGFGTDTVTGKNGGVDIERIRYYENKWQYKAVGGTDWVEFTTSMDESGNQIAAYYLLKTEVTTQVTTYITDWPDPQTKPFYGVALDYCVKYESDSTRNPDTFGKAANKNTQWFNCVGEEGDPFVNGYTLKSTDTSIGDWKGNGSNGWYRVINNIRAVETDKYEIYMVTATPSNKFSSEGNQQCPDSITYPEEGEKVIWAENEDVVSTSGLTAHGEIKYGGTPDINRVVIQQCTGMLITYYVRAKANASLTVHYIDDTAGGTEFYKYGIAVDSNTLFSEAINFDETNGVLTDYTVKNSNGDTQKIESNLQSMPKIDAKYRYSKYKCVSVERSADGKDFYLHYTFDNKVTFVVDFGLPLKVTPAEVNEELSGKANSVNVTQKDVEYGTVTVSGADFTYTLNKMINGYEMIVAEYSGVNTETNTEGKVAYNVYIIPATNVYYEDSFAKFTNGSYVDGESKSQEIKWGIEGTSTEANATQALEALGTKENVYGYDPAYDNCTMFSMGSAQKVTVTSEMAKDGVVWPTAQFTFKGTGFDIISLTDNTSGAIFVDVTGKSTNKTKTYVVNNYYGYKYDEATNTWEADTTGGNNALYQIPVIAVRGLDYDEYNVVITVAYNTLFDKTKNSEYSFWLDAVRVYDPMGKSVDTGETYKQDGEAYPQYIKLRNELAKEDGSVTVDSAKLLFIDGAENAAISLYKNYGPNNEVYLAKGQAITFKLNIGNAQIKTVQIGAKAPMSGDIAKLSVSGTEVVEKELSSATEMYYDISAVKDGSNVTITNTGEAILSLTNLKITFNAQGSVSLGAMNAEEQAASVMAVRALFAPAPVEPEPEPEPEKTFEPERFEASWTKNVMQGRKATLTVKTSEDVEAITVDGQTIRSYRTRTERVGFGRRAKRITYREFTYSMVAQESADFRVTAINAEGTESEAITARLTVKTRPNSMRDMWDWFKGWF